MTHKKKMKLRVKELQETMVTKMMKRLLMKEMPKMATKTWTMKRLTMMAKNKAQLMIKITKMEVMKNKMMKK